LAKEAIEAYLEVMREDGLPIPTIHRSRVAVLPGGKDPGQALPQDVEVEAR